MGSNNINSLNGSQWLHSQVLAIAGEIKTSPMSPKKYAHLSQQLDTTFEALQSMENKTNNLFVKTQTDYLKQQCQELYHKLDCALIDREIALIQDASKALKGRASLPAIKKLESNLNALFQKYAPSVQEHQILSQAKRAIEEAKLQLNGQKSHQPVEWLEKKSALSPVGNEPLVPQEIEELFEIAKWVYQGDLKRAKLGFAQLPAEHKERVLSHMNKLEGELFANETSSIQALIASANDLAGNGLSYFSKEQIEEFFSGLAQVNAEGSGEKIFSISFGA